MSPVACRVHRLTDWLTFVLFSFQLPALKNADDMLDDVLKAVDTNRDGRIDYNGKIDNVSDCLNFFHAKPAFMSSFSQPNSV